jgi:hypothetical protein
LSAEAGLEATVHLLLVVTLQHLDLQLLVVVAVEAGNQEVLDLMHHLVVQVVAVQIALVLSMVERALLDKVLLVEMVNRMLETYSMDLVVEAELAELAQLLVQVARLGQMAV